MPSTLTLSIPWYQVFFGVDLPKPNLTQPHKTTNQLWETEISPEILGSKWIFLFLSNTNLKIGFDNIFL